MTDNLHGTLCVTLPCKDGLIICSDKRLNRAEDTVHDAEVKVQQLGNKAAFIVTHLIRADGLDGVPHFEPIRTVKTFLADKHLNYLEKHKAGLAEALRSAINVTFQSRCNILPGNVDYAASQVIIWYLDAVNNLQSFNITVEFDESQIS